MFKIRFQTIIYRPDLHVTIRNNVDGWEHDIPGTYEDDEWLFILDESHYPDGMELKFVLDRTYWMKGGNELLHPEAGGDYTFANPPIEFPPLTEAVVENSYFQRLFFQPNLDEEYVFDVIVIGSGIGGRLVAEHWGEADTIGMLVQMGVDPFAGRAAM
jgi:hypothetical protein